MIGTTTARIILGVSLAPFGWYAARDQLLHFRVRRVSLAENVLHVLIGLSLAFVIGRAMQFDAKVAAMALLVFAAFGAIDEFVFHRRIPEVEHSVHAKEHFALLGWVAVFGALVWWR